MNYEPNTRVWRKGDIVIHDADFKSPAMFMKVIGYTRDGLVKTQYVSRKFSRKVYTNEPKYLHHPDRFELHYADDPDAWERVRRWNYYHPEGTRVLLMHHDGSLTEECTRSKAWLAGRDALVSLEGKTGGYSLDILKVQREELVQA